MSTTPIMDREAAQVERPKAATAGLREEVRPIGMLGSQSRSDASWLWK